VLAETSIANVSIFRTTTFMEPLSAVQTLFPVLKWRLVASLAAHTTRCVIIICNCRSRLIAFIVLALLLRLLSSIIVTVHEQSLSLSYFTFFQVARSLTSFKLGLHRSVRQYLSFSFATSLARHLAWLSFQKRSDNLRTNDGRACSRNG